MNPVAEYLTGALLYATLYYAGSWILWPSDRSAVVAISGALIWGLIMQAVVTRRARMKKEGKEPYPPIVYAGAGLLGLVACVVCWFCVSPRPTGIGLAGLLAGTGFSVYLIMCAFTVARRVRVQATLARGS